MSTSVETRRGIFVTTIKNQLLSAVLWFLMNGLVFGWVITGWEHGSILIGFMATVFYMSGIYSYAYSQPKLDMIIKKRNGITQDEYQNEVSCIRRNTSISQNNQNLHMALRGNMR